MTKAIQKELEQIVRESIGNNNPYINQSTVYYIDRIPHYVFRGDIYTKESLQEEYIKTALKDAKFGYSDRMVGYYDKWYRYNRMDEGYAYDIGVKFATKFPKCSENLTIIGA